MHTKPLLQNPGCAWTMFQDKASLFSNHGLGDNWPPKNLALGRVVHFFVISVRRYFVVWDSCPLVRYFTINHPPSDLFFLDGEPYQLNHYYTFRIILLTFEKLFDIKHGFFRMLSIAASSEW